MANETKWYNLSEMARLTGINRAQLHKYVNKFKDRIPSVKDGNRTKFPEEAVRIFEEIRAEGLRRVGKAVTQRTKAAPSEVRKRVGRPKAAAKKTAAKKKAAAKKRTAAKRAGSAARPAQRAATTTEAGRLVELERSLNALQKQLAALEKEMKKPIVVKITRS